MNGATAWNPASARAGSRCFQVWAVSGKPCRHSASGPEPASSSPNSRSLACTDVICNGTGTAMDNTLPSVGPLGVILQPGWSLRLMPRARCGLCLPALAQQLTELADRLVLI